MTYPDRTCYPVASCNDQDFQNLMHVYLDAVFYPNIYHKEEIFRQEGWNYHLEKKEGPLTYNCLLYTSKRPTGIEVELYKNGTATGKKVTLDENNHWKHTWTDLDEKANGQKITYSCLLYTSSLSDCP